MRIISALSSAFVLIILIIGCNNSVNGLINSESIIGKWQNLSTPSSSIEFTKSNEYIVWINGKTDNLSKPLKYRFDPLLKKDNFIIGDLTLRYNNLTKGNIDFIDSENVKISILGQDNEIISSSEFRKLD